MLQQRGSAFSVRRHSPSRLGPRGKQARATGHRVSRSSMLFRFFVLSCYCYMFTWIIAICPSFLRAEQRAKQFSNKEEMSNVRAAIRNPNQIHVAERKWRHVTGYLSSLMLVCFLFNHVVATCKLDLWPSILVSFEQDRGKNSFPNYVGFW